MIEQLTEDLAQRGGKKASKNTENLPKPVAKHEFQGFRNTVTDVRFHPVVTFVAASSEDGTVKVRHSLCCLLKHIALSGVGLREWRV